MSDTPKRAATASVGAANRGRPKGARTKPKTETVSVTALKEKLAPFLSREDWNYLSGVLGGQEKPVLEKDIDIFLSLQLKALLPQLADEISGGQLTREATQRSSTIKELLALRFQMEKHEKGDDVPNAVTFIQNVFESRGIDPARLATLSGAVGSPIEGVSVALPRTPDGDQGDADETGAVSDSVPERQE